MELQKNMDNSEFSQVLESFLALKLDATDDRNSCELGVLYDACTKLVDRIENSNLPSHDQEVQVALKAAIHAYEQCTRLVNVLGLFSSNETAEEIQTSSIRYLLLPALLGSLHLQMKSENSTERHTNIERANVYFKDFLDRCLNYELCGAQLDHLRRYLENEGADDAPRRADPSRERERKIHLFKQKKALEDREDVLRPAIDSSEDYEEYVREYYLVLIEKWIIVAIEDLESSKREMEILNFKTKGDDIMRDLEEKLERGRKGASEPLKPFILTKNETQKQVFGLGYPSVPVLTIDDWYRHRFEKQIEEQKKMKLEEQSQQRRGGRSLQEAALSGEGLSKDEEEVEKERLVEMDDPAALAKARQWDDWKDENPRGAGNRYNKG